MIYGFLKTAKVHLIMCKQVKRMQCFCYMIVFNTASPGCVIFLLRVSWTIDCLVFCFFFFFNSLRAVHDIFPSWISNQICIWWTRQHTFFELRQTVTLSSCSCMLRLLLDPRAPALLPALPSILLVFFISPLTWWWPTSVRAFKVSRQMLDSWAIAPASQTSL